MKYSIAYESDRECNEVKAYVAREDGRPAIGIIGVGVSQEKAAESLLEVLVGAVKSIYAWPSSDTAE